MSKVIEDKGKRKQLNAIFKDVEKYEKKFKKEKKAYLKQLEKLNSDQKATAEQFNVVGETMVEVNTETLDFMVNTRLSIGKVITKEEWLSIIAEGRKRFVKSEKQYVKVYPKLEKAVSNLNGRIESIIEDETKAKLITDRVKNFHKMTAANSKELNAYNVFDNPVLSNIESSEDELRLLNPAMLKLRKEVFNEYVAIHNLIAANCTAKEWRIVINKFNKLY